MLNLACYYGNKHDCSFRILGMETIDFHASCQFESWP
jgi:hypothetical protein